MILYRVLLSSLFQDLNTESSEGASHTDKLVVKVYEPSLPDSIAVSLLMAITVGSMGLFASL